MSPFLRRSRVEPATIDAHERLNADPTATLVRLAGTWNGSKPCPAADARLIVADEQPRAPLAGSAVVDGRSWRLAFAVAPSAEPRALAIGGSELPLREHAERSLPEPTPELDDSKPADVEAEPDAAQLEAEPDAAQLEPEPDAAQLEVELEDAREQVRQLQVRCKLAERELGDVRVEALGDPAATPKLVRAWGEAAELRLLITEREERHREALAEAARLRRREAMLREGLDEITAGLAVWREKAAAECDRLKAELAAARRTDAGDIDVAEIERARSEAARLRDELSETTAARLRAEREADELRSLAAKADSLERDLVAARSALAEADQHVEQLAAELRDRGLEIERRDAAIAEQTSRSEAGESSGPRRERRSLFGLRRTSDVEGALRLAEAKADNARLEQQVAELTERLREFDHQRGTDAEQSRGDLAELEQRLAKQQAVEEDLRALLESERRHSAEARLAADGLRSRLTDLPADVGDEPQPPPTRDENWSAMDAELLARLERAKAISSSA